nr:hypothetical protein [Tanacetum cinerariifolium]
KLFFNLRSQKKRLAWLNNEEVHRVAESLGVEPREVREMESRLTGHDMAFDPAAEADDDSAFQSPANYLEDHRYDPARQLEDSDWTDSSTANLHEALNVLDDRSRDILYQRWLAEEKATLHDLAEKYNPRKALFLAAQVEEQLALGLGGRDLHDAPVAQNELVNFGLDPVHCKGHQTNTHFRVEAFNGLHEADVTFLDQVSLSQSITGITACDMHDKSQVGEHHLPSRP